MSYVFMEFYNVYNLYFIRNLYLKKKIHQERYSESSKAMGQSEMCIFIFLTVSSDKKGFIF